MINLKDGTYYATPYPVSIFDGYITDAQFSKLVADFPTHLSTERRAGDGVGKYNKDCLADRHHPDAFAKALVNHPAWTGFYMEIKERFPELCLEALGSQGLSFDGYGKPATVFEFSSLPGEGGGLLPHPDSEKKVATAVFYMEDDWDDAWGGAFEVCIHNEKPRQYVERAQWSEVTTSFNVPVRPNRVVFMQRTPWSLHGVRPLTSPRPRRSITVNCIARQAK